VADNRLAELAGWDEDILALELQELSALDLDFELEITGFEGAQLAPPAPCTFLSSDGGRLTAGIPAVPAGQTPPPATPSSLIPGRAVSPN
jgi:hypothetical protein